MRTHEEIATRIRNTKDDFLSFSIEVLLDYLPWAYAKEFLKGKDRPPEVWDGKDAGDFAGFGPPTGRTIPLDPGDRDFILEAMRHYAAFGWRKIESHRGLSASRTVDRMKVWLWLLEDNDLLAEIEDGRIGYENYGAPILHAICVKYNFPIPDGSWATRMAQGQACCSDCDEGCGR